jgi:hypothetical protein
MIKTAFYKSFQVNIYPIDINPNAPTNLVEELVKFGKEQRDFWEPTVKN